MRTCPQCGTTRPKTITVCPSCGGAKFTTGDQEMKKFSEWMNEEKKQEKKKKPVTRTCNRCNAERPSTVTFCPKCGSPEFRVEKKTTE